MVLKRLIFLFSCFQLLSSGPDLCQLIKNEIPSQNFVLHVLLLRSDIVQSALNLAVSCNCTNVSFHVSLLINFHAALTELPEGEQSLVCFTI